MLEADKVEVRIGGAPILRGVNLTVRPGETIALVGRNGAGKTTTLRAIMGLAALSGGSVRFDGADLAKVPAHQRPGLGIGYAPEDRRLFSAFSVETNIRFAGDVAGLGRTEVDRRLQRVYGLLPELADMARRPAGSVSGGQGKMVALGRALMLGTRLIFLDEPFQGLAPALAHRYAEALKALRDLDRSLAILITESNPGLLERFAERTVVIERGQISETVPERAMA